MMRMMILVLLAPVPGCANYYRTWSPDYHECMDEVKPWHDQEEADERCRRHAARTEAGEVFGAIGAGVGAGAIAASKSRTTTTTVNCTSSSYSSYTTETTCTATTP